VIHADRELARRLEAIICAEWRRLAETARSLWPEKAATCLEVAGGVALWLGEGSLVNVAVGLAMEGAIGQSELKRVEDFYTRRGAPPILATCPFADSTLFALLSRRGWQMTEFENVLALELGAAAAPPSPMVPAPPAGVEVRVCAGAERELWGSIAARGFSDDAEPGSAHEEFGSLMAARDDAILVLGWVDGRPAGTGTLVIDGGVGWLSGDSTLPHYRGRGIQQAIQRHRLRLARDAGCDLAVTESAPGSGSQRNMERLGFRVVYAHVEFAAKGLTAPA
jgi:GNAT superfamily N-acetyltransferase